MSTTTRTLRVGTRGSRLARIQTGLVVAGLEAAGLQIPVQIVPIVTEGDRSTAAMAQIGGTGVFVSALRRALLEGEIDVAVHSYKDLPTLPDATVVVAAVPRREDPRDALIAREGWTLAELPGRARVGTGSIRRTAQLRALGLGFDVVPLRGNVDTRLGRVGADDLDAVVLAYAGLRRLGRADEVTEVLDPLQLLPAPAQGALAVECRAGDLDALAVLSELDDLDSRTAVDAERALLYALEAGCSAPIGALAEVVEDDDGSLRVFLRASVTAADGSDAIRLSATGTATDAQAVGRRLAADLLAAGANQMMGSSK